MKRCRSSINNERCVRLGVETGHHFVVWSGTFGTCTSKTLYLIALALPTNTVACERAFSTMNQVKTLKRSRLSSSSLVHVMNIAIMGPNPPEYCVDRALKRWWVEVERRGLRQVDGDRVPPHLIERAMASLWADDSVDVMLTLFVFIYCMCSILIIFLFFLLLL